MVKKLLFLASVFLFFSSVTLFLIWLSILMAPAAKPGPGVLDAHIIKEFKSKEQIPGAYRALSYLSASRAYPREEIPAASHYQAFEKSTLIQKRSSLQKTVSPWQPMGPHNQGGRTLAIAFNPQNPNTIFAGSASGGLWRSYSGGRGAAAWERIETGFPVLSVSTIAIAPGDSNTIYIGTGEVYNHNLVGEGAASRSLRGFYGIGILKTTNGGLTWTKILDWSLNQTRGVWAVKLDPSNPDIVWAATTIGTFKSTDAGASWMQVHDVIMAMDLVIDPDDPNIVLVGCGNFASPGFGIYRTTDGGENWQQATQGLPSFFRGKIQFDVFDGPATNTFFASIGNGFGFNDGASWLAASTNGGASWAVRSTQDYSQWQGWFAHDAAVNPSNENEVIAVGIRVYKSTNGGFNLILKSGGSGFGGQVQPGAPEGQPTYMHADVHDVKYHPTDHNIIYFGCDGGVFRSTDGGETFEGCNGGYQTVQFYSGFSTSAVDSNLAVGGLQDNGSPLYLGSTTWSRWILGGDGAWTALDPENPAIIYASYQVLNLQKSVNGGGNFFDISPPSQGATSFIAPYVLSPSDRLTLYAGRSIIYKSIRGGLEWNAVSGVLDGNPAIAMAISANNSNVLYVATAPLAGSTRAGVFRTTDGGGSWQNITGNLPDLFPADLTVDPNDEATVYIAFSGFGASHVFKSHNYGDTWADIQGNLADVPTLAVTIDPLFSDHIYVGNDIGVFFSPNGGASWEDFNEGLPDAVIAMDLKVSSLNRKLRVATHGNGAYQRDLVGATVGIPDDRTINPNDFRLEQNFPNPFNPETTIEFFLAKRSSVNLKIYNSLGQEVRTLLERENRSVGSHRITWNSRNNAGEKVPSGVYFYRLFVGKYVATKQMVLTK